MTREESINEWIIPAIKNTWNEKKCKEIIKALEQETCDDAISRQAVIEMAYDLSEIDGEHFTEPRMVVDVEDIQNATLVTPAEKVREWIPVSERLPEENETVIVSTKYGVYPEAKYTKRYGWEWAYEAGCDYWVGLKEIVTAWMPLPEPYKVESEE